MLQHKIAQLCSSPYNTTISISPHSRNKTQIFISPFLSPFRFATDSTTFSHSQRKSSLNNIVVWYVFLLQVTSCVTEGLTTTAAAPDAGTTTTTTLTTTSTATGIWGNRSLVEEDEVEVAELGQPPLPPQRHMMGPVTQCAMSEHTCNNGKCIPMNKYCDNVNDCGDSSDEPRFCTSEWWQLLVVVLESSA